MVQDEAESPSWSGRNHPVFRGTLTFVSHKALQPFRSEPAVLTAAVSPCRVLPFPRSQPLQFMQSKMALLRVDEYLFRSWLSVVPLESLSSYLENSIDYLSDVPVRVLDCLQGISYRLPGLRKISNQNMKKVCCGDRLASAGLGRTG